MTYNVVWQLTNGIEQATLIIISIVFLFQLSTSSPQLCSLACFYVPSLLFWPGPSDWGNVTRFFYVHLYGSRTKCRRQRRSLVGNKGSTPDVIFDDTNIILQPKFSSNDCKLKLITLCLWNRTWFQMPFGFCCNFIIIISWLKQQEFISFPTNVMLFNL